jgi:hypothetical protein
MILVRVRYLLALVVAGLSAGQLKAQVTLSTTGTTNESNIARVDFTVGGGKKLDTTIRWLVEMTIGTTKIDVTKCLLNDSKGTAGTVVAPINLAAGTYDVYIKVTLSDGTMVTDKRKVTFQKILCPPPCPCPCPPPEEEVAPSDVTVDRLMHQVLQWSIGRARLHGRFGRWLL